MKNTALGFSTFTTSLVVLLVIIVAAATSFATYKWQHGKINNLNNNVSSLNSKISALNNQLSALGGQINKTCPQMQQSNTNPVCAGYAYTSEKKVSILVYTPSKNQAVSSPLAVVGEVPGNWSFEAQFPIQLKNSKGDVVAQAIAHVLGNWQTTQLVPFSAQLTYATTESGSGTIVLQKDNPSGLPKNSDSLTIPINF